MQNLWVIDSFPLLGFLLLYYYYCYFIIIIVIINLNYGEMFL